MNYLFLSLRRSASNMVSNSYTRTTQRMLQKRCSIKPSASIEFTHNSGHRTEAGERILYDNGYENNVIVVTPQVAIIGSRLNFNTAPFRYFSFSYNDRFKFDGVEYQKNVQAADGVLPFSGTGTQRIKHTLIEELVPGNAGALPVHILSQMERCILHRAISNTILNRDVPNENKTCNQIARTEKLTGNSMRKQSIWNIEDAGLIVQVKLGLPIRGAAQGKKA